MQETVPHFFITAVVFTGVDIGDGGYCCVVQA